MVSAQPEKYVCALLGDLIRQEYRGYDSCDVAAQPEGALRRSRSTQRVVELTTRAVGIAATLGIATPTGP